VDTPGLHASTKRLNQAMVRQAVDSLTDVDVVCHVLDAAAIVSISKRGQDPWAEEEVVSQYLGAVEVPIVGVLNKVDRVKPKEALLPVLEALNAKEVYSELVPVSALSGGNVDRLVDVLLAALPEGDALFPEDMVTDRAEKFLAAEFVREAVMEQTRKEIPYSVAVEIERFFDRGDIVEISAVIHVERSSQKGIIIGDGGNRIRAIGTAARLELERFFGAKVHLETFVRVESEWSENPRALHRFGYDE
jgi:GTP-binding protein Era